MIAQNEKFYNANIQSHTDYCNTVWGSVPDTVQIFKLQKRAVRLITDEHYRAHTKILFPKLNIMPIHDRVNYRLASTVHKALLQQTPAYITSMFERETRTATRNMRENALKVPKRRLDVSRRGLAYKGPILYNELNSNITNAPTIELFRTRYMAEYSGRF